MDLLTHLQSIDLLSVRLSVLLGSLCPSSSLLAIHEDAIIQVTSNPFLSFPV